MAQILLIAPNWQNEANVASRRLHDFRRWLHAGAHRCRVVASAAGGDDVDDVDDVLVVEDPLGLHGELRRELGGRFGKLRRWARELRHLPDPGIVWARAVARDPRVVAAARASQILISSSPPESSHLAALALARASGTPIWVDLQDGWIDDPLRKTLEEFPPRRWLEARQEGRVLEHARCVSVTSAAWQRMLLRRRPRLADRTLELPLAPPTLHIAPATPQRDDGRITLLHAGTFSLSHHRRQMSLLLAPLLRAAAEAGSDLRARVLLLGRLHPVEATALLRWQQHFAAHDWRLEAAPALPRADYLQRMAREHGLLLLSASMGALPSKLFEYLQSGRPILALARPGSAVWEEGQKLAALTLVDIDRGEGIVEFLARARAQESALPAPTGLDDATLAARFLARIEALVAAQ